VTPSDTVDTTIDPEFTVGSYLLRNHGVIGVTVSQPKPSTGLIQRRLLPANPIHQERDAMPRVSEVYSGDYVTAGELQGKGRVPAVIAQASVESVGQDQVQKVVLSLASRAGQAWPRRLVLNKTNSLILASAYGDDTDGWLDRQVEVWAEPTQYQGRVVPGIRLAPAVAPAIQMPPPVTAQAAPKTPDLDDSIPF